MLKDYYAILAVSPRASAADIRAAFRRLALQCHPDKTSGHEGALRLSELNRGTPDSAALGETWAPAFTEIQEAYEVLGDVARRYLYDLSYDEVVQRQEAARAEYMRQWTQRQEQLRSEAEELLKRQRQRQQQEEKAAAAAEKERLQMENFVDLSCTSRPHAAPTLLPNAKVPHAAAAAASTAPVAAAPSSDSNSSLHSRECRLNDVSTEDVDTSGLHSSQAPSLSEQRQQRQCSKGRRASDGKADGDASMGSTSVLRETPDHRCITMRSTQITFSLNSALNSAKSSNLGVSRYSSPPTGGRGLPNDHCYQRSIERTIRVFFLS